MPPSAINKANQESYQPKSDPGVGVYVPSPEARAASKPDPGVGVYVPSPAAKEMATTIGGLFQSPSSTGSVLNTASKDVPDVVSRDPSSPPLTSQAIDPSWFKPSEADVTPASAVTPAAHEAAATPTDVSVPTATQEIGPHRTVEEALLSKGNPAQINSPAGGQDQLGGILNWIMSKAPDAAKGLYNGIRDGMLLRGGAPELTSLAQNQAQQLQANQLGNTRWLAQNAPGYQAEANIQEAIGKLPPELALQVMPYLQATGVAKINQQTQQSLPGIQAGANVGEYKALQNPKVQQAQRMLRLSYGMDPNGTGGSAGMPNVGPQALASQFAQNPTSQGLYQALLNGNAMQPKQPNSPAEALMLGNMANNMAR